MIENPKSMLDYLMKRKKSVFDVEEKILVKIAMIDEEVVSPRQQEYEEIIVNPSHLEQRVKID